MNSKQRKLLIGAALIGLTASGLSGCAEQAAEADTGECHGVNSCKGTGDCSGKGHDCGGKNECKGQGWNKSSEAYCKANNGEFKPNGSAIQH